MFAAGFAEEDFTYDPHSEKFGVETGFKLEYQLRDGVKFLLSGLGRRYIHESKKYDSTRLYKQGDILIFNTAAAPKHGSLVIIESKGVYTLVEHTKNTTGRIIATAVFKSI